jgi:hypothetical protein
VSLLFILILIYRNYDPADFAFFPKCPFLKVTGFTCSGCGSQRAIHQLLQFNIEEAIKSNLLVVLAIPYIVSGFLLQLCSPEKRSTYLIRNFLMGRNAAVVVLVTVLAFGIIRNII